MTKLRALVPVLVAAVLVTGCGTELRNGAPSARGRLDSSASPAPPAKAGAPRGVATPPSIPPSKAPTKAYRVLTRTLNLRNGADRPLPTTLYYPSGSGRFPLVLFSHGLTGKPSTYQALLRRWAAAGFVVAAPAYPHTSLGVPKFDVLDVVNQPGDASYVLGKVLALDRTSGDPLRGRIDTKRVAAAGHSAGGITTVGLFTAKRDPRLRAGIVLAGSALGVGDAFAGAPASLLFVHGERDELVSYASGKALFEKVPWSKALFSLPQQGHGGPYLSPGDPVFEAVVAVTTDFLRWSLYGDKGPRGRLASDAGSVGDLDDRLS
jgi:dienelactone hydrolase